MEKRAVTSGCVIAETYSGSSQSARVSCDGRAQMEHAFESLLPKQVTSDDTNKQFGQILEALARITQVVEHNTIKLELLSDEVSKYANIHKEVLESLKEVQGMPKTYRKSLEKLSVAPDKCVEDLEQMEESAKINNFVESSKYANVQTESLETLNEHPILHLAPVECLEDLKKMEEMAKKRNFVNAVTRSIRAKFRQNFHGQGRTYCLRIMDHFFTRAFMLQCSWSGRSTTGIDKIGLSCYPHVINMFITAVQFADPEFTEEEGFEILKRCMKNAKTRLHKIRLSTSRRKGKGRKEGGRKRIIPTKDRSSAENIVFHMSTERVEDDPLRIEMDLEQLDGDYVQIKIEPETELDAHAP